MAALGLLPRAAIAASVVIAPLGFMLGSVSACGAAAPVMAEGAWDDAGADAGADEGRDGPFVVADPSVDPASMAASITPPAASDSIAVPDAAAAPEEDAGP